MKKLTLFELFCGVGGLSLGFEQTGRFNIVAGLEWDPTIAASYAKNNPDAKVFVGDICKLDIKDIAKQTLNIPIPSGEIMKYQSGASATMTKT